MNKEPRFHGETTQQRSKTMSKIKGKDTSIEVALRKALWHEGFRYRKNYKDLPGRPDIAITKYKIAIFCDSEFFHGKDWDKLKSKLEHGNNPDYWIPKIERNIERDREKDMQLSYAGWRVLHFWGNDIKNNIAGCLKAVKDVAFEQYLEE